MPGRNNSGIGGNVDPRYWSIREWKQISWEIVSVDTLLSTRPVFVFSLWISSDGGGEADGIIYNGISAAARKSMHIDTVDESMAQLYFNPPLYFSQGLYIDTVANVQQIGVQYLLESAMPDDIQ